MYLQWTICLGRFRLKWLMNNGLWKVTLLTLGGASLIKLCWVLSPPGIMTLTLHVRLNQRHHEILKYNSQQQEGTIPAPTGMSAFLSDMISLLISKVAPLCSLPLRFPRRGCAHFLLSRQNMFSSVSRTYCHVRTIFIKLTSVSENNILFLWGYKSAKLWLSPDGTGYFFYKRSKEKILWPPA